MEVGELRWRRKPWGLGLLDGRASLEVSGERGRVPGLEQGSPVLEGARAQSELLTRLSEGPRQGGWIPFWRHMGAAGFNGT